MIKIKRAKEWKRGKKKNNNKKRVVPRYCEWKRCSGNWLSLFCRSLLSVVFESFLKREFEWRTLPPSPPLFVVTPKLACNSVVHWVSPTVAVVSPPITHSISGSSHSHPPSLSVLFSVCSFLPELNTKSHFRCRGHYPTPIRRDKTLPACGSSPAKNPDTK